MAHAQRTAPGQISLTPVPSAEGWPVDLGETHDLRTQGGEGPVRIELITTGGPIEFGFGGMDYTDHLVLSELNHPSDEQSAPSSAQSVATELPHSDASSPLIPFERIVSEPDRAIRLKKINELQWRDGEQPASVILEGLSLKAVTHETGSARVLSGRAAGDLRSLIRSLTYLKPNRLPACRQYEDKIGTHQQIGYAGEYTSAVVHARREGVIKYAWPPTVPRNREEAQRTGHQWAHKETSLADGLCAWLAHLGLAKDLRTVPIGDSGGQIRLTVSLEHSGSHDITEVGFGVSQILPVIVGGLLQAPESIFIVDLPEAHLHPRPQALLADFFCSLAMSGQSTIVETHSEMFFHRLRLRASMSPEVADKIVVYFIDEPKGGQCALPRRVGLTLNEEPRWPRGFLQEAWETETLISLVRGTRRT
jgi:AAA ATPase domain